MSTASTSGSPGLPQSRRTAPIGSEHLYPLKEYPRVTPHVLGELRLWVMMHIPEYWSTHEPPGQ